MRQVYIWSTTVYSTASYTTLLYKLVTINNNNNDLQVTKPRSWQRATKQCMIILQVKHHCQSYHAWGRSVPESNHNSHDLFTQNNFKLENWLPESFNSTERFTELDPPEFGACWIINNIIICRIWATSWGWCLKLSYNKYVWRQCSKQRRLFSNDLELLMEILYLNTILMFW